MTQYAPILDMANEARTRIREVAPDQLDLQKIPEVVWLDVRESAEFRSGHIPGAVHLSWTEIQNRVAELIPERSTPIIAYCAIGHRSAIAADILQKLGYDDVVSIKGGLQAYDLSPAAGAHIARVA
jgi:phage shock protein E